MNLSWKRPDDVSFPNIWHSFEVTTKDGRTQKIQIEDVSPSRYDDFLDFMAHYFDFEAPITRAIGSHSDQLVADKRTFRRKILEQKVSLYATAVDSDKEHDSPTKVIGVLLLYVLTKTDPPFRLPGDYGKVMNVIFKQLKKDIDLFTMFKCDKYLDEAGLGVAPEYQGLKIGYQLVSCLPTLGKALNLFGSVMVCSASGSQIIAERLGFQLLKEIRYEECKNEKGEPVLPDIEASPLKYMFLKFT